MQSPAAFDASAWIANNTVGGTQLTSDSQQAVAAFTAMWNFFESTLCNNSASIAAFEQIAERLDAPRVPEATRRTLESCLAFWRFRYKTPEGFGHRFEGLNFRSRDRRDHVEAVLQGTATEPHEKLLAQMIIVYRLRNNLFHGIKTLDMLNDQTQNLWAASRCLAAILEAVPTRFVSSRRVHAAG
ncbi:hypothetical protein [Acidovorax lacteus]|uniref:hypothetical protein n=1 Tax=Acidovorax lacteus TaxID=1924988 RepID=UPI0031EFA7AC